jgi:hypothetical protein
MNKRDLEAKRRWTKLRTKISWVWGINIFDPKILEYMRWLLNKRVLVPAAKSAKPIRVLGIELGTYYKRNKEVDACIISGTTDNGQFVQFYFTYNVIPIRCDEPGSNRFVYGLTIIWRAVTPKFRAMLLAQELEKHDLHGLHHLHERNNTCLIQVSLSPQRPRGMRSESSPRATTSS